MTSLEFQEKLRQMYGEYPIIAANKRKTVNELFYVLRMDKENDYNINIIDNANHNIFGCIPSVKECFVPVRDLVKHVKKVVFDENDYGCPEICLSIIVED